MEGGVGRVLAPTAFFVRAECLGEHVLEPDPGPHVWVFGACLCWWKVF